MSTAARVAHIALKRDRGPNSLACPACGSTASIVVDSRGKGGRIWRRRMCRAGHRYNTVELAGNAERVAQLNGLMAQLDRLSPDDLVMVAGLAARLAYPLADRPRPLSAENEGAPSGVTAEADDQPFYTQTARTWEAAAGQGSGDGGEEAPPGPVPSP